MRKQRKIKKEDIGDPSNFVHIKHVGFGPRMAPLQTQESFDSTLDGDSEPANNGDATPDTPTFGVNDEYSEETFSKVERRNKGTRFHSQIPRHHRSTTTCIFPTDGESPYSHSQRKNSTIENNRDSNGTIPDSRPLAKPTFGSLLNLSFLPLGLGKSSSSSSSKSPSIGKAKRMSLLNLTSTNLFAPSPKGKTPYEENRESVHMTGYIRRRSFSKDENIDNAKPVQSRSTDKTTNHQPKAKNSTGNPPTRIPLAKLGRSKSTMSDFAKRPKLRLKIVPPTVPPPVPPVVTTPTPVVMARSNNIETENLPSPPPSPIPSPPPSPVPDTLFPVSDQGNDVTLRRSPKSQTRPRIIPLPSTSSVDTMEPTSPQYLTPAGGSSPLLNNETFPLSPTMPPLSTPFFPATRSAPGTPPVWPMQPSWPTSISMQSKEPTIPEIPSPCKEQIDMVEDNNEYAPVLSIVESFISKDQEHESLTAPNSTVENTENNDAGNSISNLAVSPSSIASITSILRENIQYTQWPVIAQRLFDVKPIETLKNENDDSCTLSTPKIHENKLYEELLTKTLEFWVERAGSQANVDNLLAILREENHHEATESLREILQNTRM